MKILLFTSGSSLLALVFLSLFVPTAYVGIKVIFLLLALSNLLIFSCYSKLVWSYKTLLACLLVSSFGFANSLHGLVNGAPGAFKVLTVMAIWPILYAVISSILNRPQAIKLLFSTLKVSLIAVLFYSYLFLGNMAGIVPDLFYIELEQAQNVGFYEGVVEFSLSSTASLLFLIPLWLHMVINLVREKKAKLIYWIVLLFSLLLCVLTGRRALLLVVVLSPAIVLVTEMILGRGRMFLRNVVKGFVNWKSVAIVLIFISGLAFLFATIDIHLNLVFFDFIEGFNFSDSSNIASSERANQFISLMHAWGDGNLLFGKGNGSHTNYLRSYEMPWAYELTYIYLLFSTGIVGVVFYMSWFTWGVIRLRKALLVRSDMLVTVAPMITGMFSLAIGAASNPYFSKFDYLWIIFLPHLLAGAIKHQEKGAK